jgi:hypothetical protein
MGLIELEQVHQPLLFRGLSIVGIAVSVVADPPAIVIVVIVPTSRVLVVVVIPRRCIPLVPVSICVISRPIFVEPSSVVGATSIIVISAVVRVPPVFPVLAVAVIPVVMMTTLIAAEHAGDAVHQGPLAGGPAVVLLLVSFKQLENLVEHRGGSF